jgi:hypothetical protein
LLALPLDSPVDSRTNPDDLFDPVAARGLHLSPAQGPELSKKEDWLREKTLRPDAHLSDADLSRYAAASRKLAHRGRALAGAPDLGQQRGGRIEPVTTLYNIWTHEALPILPGDSLDGRFPDFLRDHYTNQATHMDTRLVGVLTDVANRFSAKRIEVVSGYRSPKYNLMLRKKGHQVARHSQHMEGHAVDFRIRGVATRDILHYVRSLRVGGVGFYPHSQFVHSDTGPIRYWTGS